MKRIIKKAHKEYQCSRCNIIIAKGNQYVRVKLYPTEEPYVGFAETMECLECSKISMEDIK